jgi:hypothetical protein
LDDQRFEGKPAQIDGKAESYFHDKDASRQALVMPPAAFAGTAGASA